MQTQFQLIKGGETHPVDIERVVPGRVVALQKNSGFTEAIFRLEDRYYVRTVFHSLNCVVRYVRENMDEWTTVNRSEWVHLKDLAGKKAGAPTAKPEEPAGPEGRTYEGHSTHGHRWAAPEFRKYFKAAKDARLVAYGSSEHEGITKAKGPWWGHEALFRLEEIARSGYAVHMYCETSEVWTHNRYRRVWQLSELKNKYGAMDRKLLPLEPAAAGGKAP